MALTIRKKNGLLIPKTPSLIIPGSVFSSQNNYSQKDIIEDEIKRIVKECIGVNSKIGVKRIVFVPIYCKRNGEKEMSKIYMKYKTRSIEKIIDVDYIESFGVTLVEFFDYIITHGATEIQNSSKALEIM